MMLVVVMLLLLLLVCSSGDQTGTLWLLRSGLSPQFEPVVGCPVALLALPLQSCVVQPLLLTRCGVAFLVLVLDRMLIFVLLPSTIHSHCTPERSRMQAQRLDTDNLPKSFTMKSRIC